MAMYAGGLRVSEVTHLRVFVRGLNIEPSVRHLVARQEVSNCVRARRPPMAEHPDALEARPKRRAPILQEIVEHRVEVVLRRVPRLQEVMMDFGFVDGANRRVSIGVGREQDAFRVRINFH